MNNLDEITGLPKTVHIEYFLNGCSIGKTMVSKCSMPISRKMEAKKIGIDYYDRFVLDNGRADSEKCLLPYGGVMKPLNDFDKCDEITL